MMIHHLESGEKMTKTITLTVEMNDEQALQFAQFL